MTNLKIDYEDCLNYIRMMLNVKLFPYQEEMLRALCDGYEVRTARGIGRSFVASCIGNYVAYMLGKNNYLAKPDIEFTSECAIKHGLLTSEKVRKMEKDVSIPV